jgi:hypothetical protein
MNLAFMKQLTTVKVSELKLVSNNLFKRLERHLRAEGRPFELYCGAEIF